MTVNTRTFGSFALVCFLEIVLALSAQAASWRTNSAMATARQFHTATLLTNGLVLVAGGEDAGFTATASAEIYVPATKTWTNTMAMNVARELFTATLLPNGKVLVAGGFNSDGTTSTAELFDPVAGSWTMTGDMTNSRSAHTATLLETGNVLVTGGRGNGDMLAEAEIYDVASGVWLPAAPMNSPRDYHTASLLPGGRVLVVGGRDGTVAQVDSAEVYNPQADEWTPTGNLAAPRRSHTATRLTNGKILVVGGDQNGAEIYDPLLASWSPAGELTNQLYGHTAALLANGKVLIAGGIDYATDPNAAITNAWLYNPPTESWHPTADLNQGRYVHTATVLPNGEVLVTGGGSFAPPFRLQSAETFVPIDPIMLNILPAPAGQFRLSFTNTAGFQFGVLTTTNIFHPIENWTALGNVTEISPGQFQFTDPQATNSPQRFYRVRAN
jgi:N-acetylneuraminic acid mutarotase